MGQKSFVSIRETVGYKPDEKVLVVTLTSQQANAMKAHGWNIGFEKEIGHFIRIEKGE